jgi:hypothetical protein
MKNCFLKKSLQNKRCKDFHNWVQSVKQFQTNISTNKSTKYKRTRQKSQECIWNCQGGKIQGTLHNQKKEKIKL